MISPLCTNCHDITVILLNVELNTINLTFGNYRRKSKLNTEKIGKIWKKGKLNSEKI
jgi:hypothetical protein